MNNWGVAKLVKAPDFDSGIRGFESFLPSQIGPMPQRASLYINNRGLTD